MRAGPDEASGPPLHHSRLGHDPPRRHGPASARILFGHRGSAGRWPCAPLGWPAVATAELALEPRQNGLEEGVLDERHHDLPGAGLRVVQRAANVGLRGHLIAREVFQELAHPARHRLIKLLEQALGLILLGIIDVQLADQGLDVALHGAVLHPVVLKNSAALLSGLPSDWCILGDAMPSCLNT
jgi:hypothetical protein